MRTLLYFIIISLFMGSLYAQEKEQYNKIQDSAKEIQKLKTYNDSSYGMFKFDHDYFLDNNITKVPMLLLSLCKGKKKFPSRV